MAIYDNNGTTSYQIGKVYDNNATTSYQIGKVYDNNGTTSSLIYEDEYKIVENGIAKITTGNFTQGSTASFNFSGNSNSRRTDKIDLTNYKTLHIRASFTCGNASLHMTMGVYSTFELWSAVKEIRGQYSYTDPLYSVGTHTLNYDLDISNLKGSYYIGFCTGGSNYITQSHNIKFTTLSLS